jgi:prepilin-type N-terminal cleavage/methylation domain-containing protein
MMNRITAGLKSMQNSDAGGTRQKGFTLIELLVTMAVASVVMAAIYSVYMGLTRSYTRQNATADAQQAVRATIAYMAEDIMMAGFDSQKTAFTTSILPIEYADSIRLRVKADRNMDGTIDDDDPDALEFVTYSYNSAAETLDQIRLEGIVGKEDSDIFMDNVTAFSFAYLDADGNDLGDPVPAADRDDIRTVVISMTVAEWAGREGRVDRLYNTQVKCRNLGL